MSKLRIYTVHIDPAQPSPYEAAEFIEDGFNWKAFFFTGLWALYYRLWWVALAIVVFNGLVMQMLASGVFTHVGVAIIQLGMFVLVGYQANDWRRAALRKRGFITTDIVTGDSMLRAEQRFFDRYFAVSQTA